MNPKSIKVLIESLINEELGVLKNPFLHPLLLQRVKHDKIIDPSGLLVSLEPMQSLVILNPLPYKRKTDSQINKNVASMIGQKAVSIIGPFADMDDKNLHAYKSLQHRATEEMLKTGTINGYLVLVDDEPAWMSHYDLEAIKRKLGD
jgi:hypothetical protein